MDFTNNDELTQFLDLLKKKIDSNAPITAEDAVLVNSMSLEIENRVMINQIELDEEITLNADLTSDEILISDLPDEIILESSTKELDLNITENTDTPVEVDIPDNSDWSSIIDDEDTDPIEEALSGIDPLEGKTTVELLDVSENLKAPLLSNIDEEKSEEPMIQEIIHFLPNGMTGKPYLVKLSTTDLKGLNIEIIEGLEGIGLFHNKVNNTIEGNPKQVGDKELAVKLVDIEPLIERKVRLFINPDPRSLWKDIDPPEDGKYYKTNSDSHVIDSEEFRLLGASTRGRSHAHEGKFRDDDFALTDNIGGWKILTVADGAGSAKYSREGSRIVCEIANSALTSILQDSQDEFDDIIKNGGLNPADGSRIKSYLYNVFSKVIMQCRSALKNEAEEIEESLSVFNTTLLLTIVKKVENGFFVASYAIGDGAAVIYTKGKDIHSLMVGDGGEFAGQTRFITMSSTEDPDDLIDRIKYYHVEDFTSILLMTDGVSDPKFDTDSEITMLSKWDDLYNEIMSDIDLTSDLASENLTEWLDFFSRGNHDDRTLALLVKKNN